jgi:putative ubiquitin-RnfH superfamily antitoxin RatB of RatAB toxin-antitoxin module
MTPMNRILPLACAVWMLALYMAAPHAAQTAETAEGGVKVSEKDIQKNLSLFTPSENCVACHNNLITPTGEDVSIGASWRSTMMANSGRDPYWQAGVRRETIDHPTHSAAIQDECAECHMPMSTQISRASGGKGEVFAHLPFNQDNGTEIQKFAADSISCTVCHQIADDKLGTRERFNGEFVMLPTPKSGARVIFGPFQVDKGRKTVMRSVTGFEQAKADHLQKSELCATCHTLITQAFSPTGEVIGSIAEQMNFQEWQHSSYGQGQNPQSCQSCHMPEVKETTRIASELGDYRDGLHRHLFVGGNAFMVRLLNRYRTELGVEATSDELEATAKATVRQLQEQTATLSIARSELAGGKLNVDLEVRNLTGHKFPTGYPSRRTWVHLTVRDRQGRAVFESGAVTKDGLIQGNDNDADATKYEPHYDQITSADQVEIYEPIMGDPNNVPTTGLLTATHYIKDNRLLPRGFDKTTADNDIGVFGAALQDANFTGDGDRVRYSMDVPAGGGPYQVEVELLYQPIGYRWAHNLEKYDAPEPKRFVGYYNAMSAASWVVVAKTAATEP